MQDVLHATRATVEEGIVANAGGEPTVVVSAVLGSKGNYGFDIANKRKP